MPLSKKRDRYRKGMAKFQPNDDALQSISRGIKGETDSTAPPVSGIEIVHCLICGKETHYCMCGVQPKVKKLGKGIDGWGLVLPEVHLTCQGLQPIPNCPDGRYREKR